MLSLDAVADVVTLALAVAVTIEEAETEAEAREIAIEDWAEKYNVKLKHRTSDVNHLNTSLPAITVKARMDAFDPPLYRG